MWINPVVEKSAVKKKFKRLRSEILMKLLENAWRAKSENSGNFPDIIFKKSLT